MKYKIDAVISEGFVMGEILKPVTDVKQSEFVSPAIEKVLIDHSVSKTERELNDMKRKNPDLEEYLETQRLIATDPVLRKRAEDLTDDGFSAKQALTTVLTGYIKDIEQSDSEYLRERAADVNDILARLIANLEKKDTISDDDKYILYVDVLYPSLLIQRRDNLIGVIAKQGGYTSHSAIMCRSFDIPYVIANIDCDTEDLAIIDTRINEIEVKPDNRMVDIFNEEYRKRKSFKKVAMSHDKNFLFLANVSGNNDIKKVLEYDYDAVGLYRTEMIFMNSTKPFTFLEQYTIYSEAVEMMKDKFICFRTFDVGDDKQFPFMRVSSKGIDNYVNNPEIFESQVSAMLKANRYDNMRIMFPMIYTNAEFEYLRDWVIRIARKNHYKIPLIGMMLETKEALCHITDFVTADFISIGTNDLTHELYNIDRESAVSMDESLIDELIGELRPVVEFANSTGKCLSVCGELASVKDVAVRLYQIGIRNLSVSPSLIDMINLAYSEFNK